MASNEGQQRTNFATFVGQQVIKRLTDAEINEIMNDPEKLAAYTSRLKSPPMPKGSKAPLHVGTPPRTIHFHRPDGGVTQAVTLAGTFRTAKESPCDHDEAGWPNSAL